MPITHGGRARKFRWSVNKNEIRIVSESRIKHIYTLGEILSVLSMLRTQFGDRWFPLGNNVEKLYHQTERPGLGTAIYCQHPGDTLHAQGASYLGVILEECGIFEWNGKRRGISWRNVEGPLDRRALEFRLRRRGRKQRRAKAPFQ